MADNFVVSIQESQHQGDTGQAAGNTYLGVLDLLLP